MLKMKMLKKEFKKKMEVSGDKHKPGTYGTIGSTVKQHTETTGHEIHLNKLSLSLPTAT